jgi:hypothetical protein
VVSFQNTFPCIWCTSYMVRFTSYTQIQTNRTSYKNSRKAHDYFQRIIDSKYRHLRANEYEVVEAAMQPHNIYVIIISNINLVMSGKFIVSKICIMGRMCQVGISITSHRLFLSWFMHRRGRFLGNEWFKILVFPSPTSYMLTSFRFSSISWGIF